MELQNLLVRHSEDDVSFVVNGFSGYSVVYHIQLGFHIFQLGIFISVNPGRIKVWPHTVFEQSRFCGVL